ncbi:MAG: hypothetical protein QW035_01810 [Candidatus Anstonellales archaeon]
MKKENNKRTITPKNEEKELLVFVYDLSVSHKNEKERNRIKRRFYYNLNKLIKEGQGVFITESVFSISPNMRAQVIELFSETEDATAFMIEAKGIKTIKLKTIK